MGYLIAVIILFVGVGMVLTPGWGIVCCGAFLLLGIMFNYLEGN